MFWLQKKKQKMFRDRNKPTLFRAKTVPETVLGLSLQNTVLLRKYLQEYLLSAQCVSRVGQIIKSVCVSVCQSVSLSHKTRPLHISGTVEATNFRFGTHIGHCWS